MTEPPRRRSPLRVAVYTFAAVIVLGIGVGGVMIGVVNPGGSPFARGELLGRGLGMLSVVCAAIAYLIQRRRTRR